MISQTAEYALRAVVLLGNNGGNPMTTQDIARESKVPGGYLSKVLQSLGRAGLVEARRGLHGGYVLTRPLDELTIYDVVNSVDPLTRILTCPLRLESHSKRLCPLHQKLDDAVAMLEETFKQTTIGSLLREAGPDSPKPLCDIPALVGGLGFRGPAPSAR
ncbi:Rrf2 family transcriptional regulator [Aquisphaera insulae]|uniref:Rrf2 family transcriptional regulator n=1 Tax=Aquisphaera insulae TaxID=2712864 RepID=UPI0013EE1BF7|nr:Rrf2 family transcriptional regulator [Aquisphaera insulae]